MKKNKKMEEKNELVVGVVLSTKKMKKKNNSSAPRKFWPKLVTVFFNFCVDVFGEKPSFNGSAAKSMGEIIDSIELKCREKEIEYTEDMACRSWKLFLITAHEDKWLQENFVLTNLNKFKDKIFFKLSKQSKDGKQSTNLKARVQAEFDRRYGSKG